VTWPFPRRRSARARLGARGERAALRHVRRQGYRVLGRNLRTEEAEIDLLALHEGALVVVEVKTLSGRPPADPLRLVRGGQRRRLAAAARALARRPALRTRIGERRSIRIDLAVVSLDGRHPLVTIRRDAWRAYTRT